MLLLFMGSCTWEEITPVKIPVSEEKDFLDAEYTLNSLDKFSAPHWKTADYRIIPMTDLVTKQVDGTDGILNTSGTYNGLADFNKGNTPNLTLKAAYDDDNIYVVIAWDDISFDPSQLRWVYDGPADPLKSGANTAGWTSQGSDDKLMIGFDMGNNKKDVWEWSLALSEPLGYAIDMIDDGGLKTDTGDKLFIRNTTGTDYRSGPKYEWDGVEQQLERMTGGFTILDPGFYLLNTMPFTGDVANGDALYQLECAECHGIKGDGEGFTWATKVPVNIPGVYNRLSRGAFDPILGNISHGGSGHWVKLSEVEKNDVIARIRGFAGVPGYYLEDPAQATSDVFAYSNVQLAKINSLAKNEEGYRVMFKRALDTGSNEDIVFAPGNVYNFEIRLADHDGLNYIGAISEKLIVRSKP
ncbi:MAG: hypothetical protein OEX02_10170 [Cyclobacteriaceae bacterium]|nr:hypothetical protein [Cyclobacteriaceae bacterium]